VSFRDGPFENLKVPLTFTAAIGLIAAGAVALLLLLGDKRETLTADGYGGARKAFDSVAAPTNGVLAAPVRWAGQASDWIDDYFFAVSENRRLKARVAELETWRDAAIALKNVNARYEAMLNIRTQPPIPMVTARAVSESRGPFVNSRLIDVGSNDCSTLDGQKGCVKIGNPVINEHGLVGRVVGTTGSVSRVLLLTDVASKTPVLIDRSDARAILVGDGSGNPKLEFLRGPDSIKNGDRILTSGDGGVLPRGLPVGVAAKGIDGTWRVKLFSDRGAVDFVRVLMFEDFSQLVRPEALNPPPLAALGTAPPPEAPRAAPVIAAPAPTTGAATPPAAGAAGANTPPAATTARPQPTAPAQKTQPQPPRPGG